MHAVVVRGPGDLRVDTWPDPSPGPGEVLIRVTHGGICGSDLHYYREGRVGSFMITEPMVLGHEIVGTVVTDMADGDALAPGTPVAVHPASYRPDLDPAERARPNISRGARYLGSAATTPHTQGGLSEYVVVRRDQVRILPAGLPLDRAVLAEPLGVAVHALRRYGDVAGARVLVLGLGPIGLLTVRAAIVLGADRVYGVDVISAPRERAVALGATGVWDAAEAAPERDFDLVVEASGAPASTTAAVRLVRSGGVVVQVGILPGEPARFTLAELVAREVDLRGAFRFHTEMDDAIDLLARDPSFAAVVSHRFGLHEMSTAFEVAADAARSGKVVIEMPSERTADATGESDGDG